MSTKISKGDFVEIDYTGKVDGAYFDTTEEDIAKKMGIHNPNMAYGPVIVCVGQKHILEGIDDALVDRETESKFSVTLNPEKAFGKKDAKLIRLVPMSVFKKQGMNPHVGQQVQIDGQLATVRKVGGGRVLVDFNHPLAGKDVEYDIKTHKKVKDAKKQLEAVLQRELRMNSKAYKVTFKGNSATIDFPDVPIPEPIAEQIEKRIVECVASIKKVNVKSKEPETAETKE